ncbi:MAG: hypothetical protein WD712_00195 [Candidatus Spechtbacterales bacterium]
MSEEYTVEDRLREDVLFLRETLNPRSPRVSATVLDNPVNLEIAEGTGLTVSESRRLALADDAAQINVSLTKKVKDVPGIIGWIDKFFYDQDVFRRAHMLYLQTADMIVADACTFMLDKYHDVRSGEHEKCCVSCDTEAEISILLGLFFGYRLCCVMYYVNTRYLGRQGYEEDMEIAYDEHGHYRGVPCLLHARERMKAKGQTT